MLTPKQFIDYVEEVFQEGASKHGANSWLEGINFNQRANQMSMHRHLAKATLLDELVDVDSQLLHYQHLATRALMEVHRLKGFCKGDKS